MEPHTEQRTWRGIEHAYTYDNYLQLDLSDIFQIKLSNDHLVRLPLYTNL